MASFDIVSKVDLQELDNATNNVKKEVVTRYDFRGTKTEVSLNSKDMKLHVVTSDEMKMNALKDMLTSHFVRRKIDSKCLEYGKLEPTSNGYVKMDIAIKEGLSTEVAKKIVKMIKDRKMKIQAAIQGDQVRVTGKKLDDLQEVITMCRENDFGIPLQYVNMK